MSTGFSDERVAIEGRLAANWTTTPIRYENRPFVQPQTAWVALHILNGEGRQVSIGSSNPLHRYVGVIQISIFTPEDMGTATQRGYADTLEAVFRRAQFSYSSSGTITCETPSIRSGPVSDGWHQLILSVPFRRDVNLA